MQSRKINAKMLLRAPMVKAGTRDALFCAVKAKPHIIAARRQRIGETYFFIVCTKR